MNKVPGGGIRATATRQAGRISVQEYVRGVWLELRRVTWPTREEWISATILTVLLVIGVGLFTWACDRLFGVIFDLIHPSVRL